MRKNQAYQPDRDDGRRNLKEPARPIRRDGYRSEDDRGRYGTREGQRPELDRGRRNDGYSSEPDQRGGDSGGYLKHDPRDYDPRDYDRRDDRYYRDEDYYRRDYHRPQFYDPRDNPYYPPGRDMYHPTFMPERDPRCQPYFRYEGDMRRKPFYMYDPMDMYQPRYRPGPEDYLMPPQFYPPRSYYPYDQRNRPSGKSRKKQRVGFEEEIEEQEFDPNEVDPYLVAEVERSKIRQRLALLVVLVIFLIASVALGAVAAAMEPWWVQRTVSGTTTFDSIRVGLWRTCYRPTTNIAWKCHKYTEDGRASPYQSITLLQWSMVVGSISAFISLCLALVAICGRKSKYLLGIIYTTLFFALAATALFGLVIAYVNEDKEAKNIVSSWTKVINANLTTGMMFAIGCAATGTSGMSLILCAVFAFIYEPVIRPAEEVVENSEETVVKQNSNKNKNIDKEVKSAPKRQGTKYVKNDRKNVQMNGHANKAPQKEPAVISKHKEAPVMKVKHLKTRETPIQNAQPGMHKMGPRQKYPPKDYGTPKMKQVQPKVGKEMRQPHQLKPTTAQPTNVANRPIPQLQQNRNAKAASSKLPIYDGDYDKYFNEPY